MCLFEAYTGVDYSGALEELEAAESALNRNILATLKDDLENIQINR